MVEIKVLSARCRLLVGSVVMGLEVWLLARNSGGLRIVLQAEGFFPYICTVAGNGVSDDFGRICVKDVTLRHRLGLGKYKK